MVTGATSATMASGGRKRSMMGMATGGERERERVRGGSAHQEVGTEDGRRRRGRRRGGSAGGDGEELGARPRKSGPAE